MNTEDMIMSTSISDLAPAFVAFSAEIEGVAKDKKVNAGKVRYKYADLASLQDYVRPILHRHGLAVTQLPIKGGVLSMLVHQSGQYVGGITDLQQTQPGCKEQGSAITYARRYALAALLNLEQEDDDGQQADGYAGLKRNNPKAGSGSASQRSTGSSSQTSQTAGRRGSRPSTPQQTTAGATADSAATGDGSSSLTDSCQAIMSKLETLEAGDRDGHAALLNEARALKLGDSDYAYIKDQITIHFKKD